MDTSRAALGPTLPTALSEGLHESTACVLGWAAMLALAVGAGSLRAQDIDGDDDGDSDHGAADGRAGQGQETAADQEKPDDEKKFRDFNEVTKGAEKIDGFFTLHHKDEHLYAEIRPHQFDQPILAPIAIARGMAMAGQPLNFGDEWVLLFQRVGDKVQLIRRNIHYKAPAGSPLEKAVKQNYTDSILMALPIVSINHAEQPERRDRPRRHLPHRLRPARLRLPRPEPDDAGTRSRRSRTTSRSRSRRPSAAAASAARCSAATTAWSTAAAGPS